MFQPLLLPASVMKTMEKMMAAEEDLTHFPLCPRQWGGAKSRTSSFHFRSPNPDHGLSVTCTEAEMRQKRETEKSENSFFLKRH